jgi:hypothetical protein
VGAEATAVTIRLEGLGGCHSTGYNKPGLIRIREIVDPDLRRRVVAALAERRGTSAAAIPEWFELDDADFVDLLNDIRGDADENDGLEVRDPRM